MRDLLASHPVFPRRQRLSPLPDAGHSTAWDGLPAGPGTALHAMVRTGPPRSSRRLPRRGESPGPAGMESGLGLDRPWTLSRGYSAAWIGSRNDRVRHCRDTRTRRDPLPMKRDPRTVTRCLPGFRQAGGECTRASVERNPDRLLRVRSIRSGLLHPGRGPHPMDRTEALAHGTALRAGFLPPRAQPPPLGRGPGTARRHFRARVRRRAARNFPAGHGSRRRSSGACHRPDWHFRPE